MTEFARGGDKIGLGRIDAAFALYQFEHDRGSIVIDRRLEFVDLVQWNIVESRNQRLEGFAVFGCVGRADR